MITEEKYNALIVKYLCNSISDLEQAELNVWLKADKNNFRHFIETKDLWENAELVESSTNDAERALEDFYHYLKGVSKPIKKSNRFVRYTMQIAATLLLALLFSFTYQWIKNYKTTTVDALKGYAQIMIPIGHKGHIILPDGTQIWMNSNTTLKYDAAFNGITRKVYLDGEAYLTVAKDPKRPFLVETSTLTLRVLGTSFNVKSYGDENITETTLIEGSLMIFPESSNAKKMRKVILKPNEKATFNKSENILSIDKLDVKTSISKDDTGNPATPDLEVSQIESVVAWKDNELIFGNETLEEICVKMERWYGIKIRIEDERLKRRGYRYNGKFIYNETITQVMDIISRTTPMEYALEKNVLIIKERN